MNQFEDLELPNYLKSKLKSINFIKPTDIQKRALPVLLAGQDVMACSQTGSGKTAAYLIPLVKSLIEDSDKQALVLAPTRELATQILDFLKLIAPNDRKFRLVSLVGGQDIRKQFKALQHKPRIIIATPGRLIDHLKRNTVQINKVQHLVLDEGDRMIDMGFAPQLEQILKHLPEKRQTSLFTATLDKKVQSLAKKYLLKPQTIMMNESKPVKKIKQSVIKVEVKEKDPCVLDEITQRRGSMIIFLKTKRRVDILTKYLNEYGVAVDKIHGGCTQGQRNKAIARFKSNKSRVLCATDIAARGLDVPHIEHVIKYDLPMQDEDYVHRVGRTGRNGASGEAISLVSKSEHRHWNRLVKKYEIPDCLLEVSKSKKDSSKEKTQKRSGRPSGKAKKAKSMKSSRSESPKRKTKSTKKSNSKKKTTSSKSSQGAKKKSGKKFNKKKSNRAGFKARKKRR